MKKLLTTTVLLVAFVTITFAQDAFYIYRNDGQFNAFFTDEIDSMAYSKYDVDSLFHDEYIVQEVFTSDSIYRIPLAVIDSIGFAQPEILYEDNVLNFTDRLFGYLLSAEEDKLFFSTEIPDSLLPAVGMKMVSLSPHDKLPLGFLGAVTDVKHDKDFTVVQCNPIALEEVVKRFYGIIKLTNDNENGPSSRAKSVKLFPTFSLPIKPIKRLKVDVSSAIQAHEFKDDKGEIAIQGAADVYISLIPKIDFTVTAAIDKIAEVPMLQFNHHFDCEYDSILIEGDIAGTALYAYRINVLKELKEKFEKSQSLTIWGAISRFLIHLEAGPYFQVAGDLVFKADMRTAFSNSIDISYSPTMPLNNPMFGPLSPIININPRITAKLKNYRPIDVDWHQIAGAINISGGVFVEAGIKLGDDKIGWAGAEIAAGISGSLKISIDDFTDLYKADKSTAFYTAINDSWQIDYIKPYVDLLLTAKIKKLSVTPYPFFKSDFEPLYKGRFLPSFENVEVSRMPGKSALHLKASVINDCLIPFRIGFTLLDSDGNIAQSPYYCPDMYLNKYSSNPTIECVFEDIKNSDEYTAYPTIKLFGKYDMIATPAVKIMPYNPVTITNVTTTAALYRPTDHPQHFEYKSNPYEFKYNVATTVNLMDDTNVENWGYVYEGPYEGDKKSRISLKGAPYKYEDTRFPYYRNGSPTSHTAKLYPFVKYKDDEEYYYGAPVDYPLVYPESSSIKLTACSTPDVVTREKVEVNGVTYDYCSTFILDYDATGAYWIGVVADEFGDGWTNWDNNLLTRQPAKAMDGSNRLTLNYYYNKKVLEGEYMIGLKGIGDTHATDCHSDSYVKLKHDGYTFTGCELKE